MNCFLRYFSILVVTTLLITPSSHAGPESDLTPEEVFEDVVEQLGFADALEAVQGAHSVAVLSGLADVKSYERSRDWWDAHQPISAQSADTLRGGYLYLGWMDKIVESTTAQLSVGMVYFQSFRDKGGTREEAWMKQWKEFKAEVEARRELQAVHGTARAEWEALDDSASLELRRERFDAVFRATHNAAYQGIDLSIRLHEALESYSSR